MKERLYKDFDDRMKRSYLEKNFTQKENIRLITGEGEFNGFIKDCSLGKTVKKGRKRTIGKSKLSNYLSFLKLMDNYWKKPFDKVTVKDMEAFISDLQKGIIKSRFGKPYTDESIHTIKASLIKFFRWLWVDVKKKPEFRDELTGWIETYVPQKEIPAFSKDQVDKLIENAPDLRLKVFFQTLFDSGARINEFLNIRWEDLTYSEKSRCYKLRLREEASKTKGRTITLPLSTKLIVQWDKEHPNKKPSEYFMPLTHRNAHALVFRWTKKILKKAVGCHSLRHSSATYYAGKLMPYVFTNRFGWSMGSKMAQRYIDREGIEIEEATERINQDLIQDYEKKIRQIQDEVNIERMQMEERLKQQEKNMAKMIDKLLDSKIMRVKRRKGGKNETEGNS